MADSASNIPKTGSINSGGGTNAPALTTKQSWLVAYVVSISVLGVVLLTLILAFHYTKAADATSVLGVVIPKFSAVIGVVVGGGAGVAAGSAGKKSVQDNLTATQNKVESAKTQMNQLEDMVKKVFEQMQQNLSSSPGVGALTLGPNLDSTHVADFGDLDSINSKMGHVKGLLE
jgi:hypothetical protein